MPDSDVLAHSGAGRRSLVLLLLLLVPLLLGGCTARGLTSGWSGVVVQDDLLHVGTREGEVLSLEAAGGAILWRFPDAGGEKLGGIYGTPVVADGLVYVAGYGPTPGRASLLGGLFPFGSSSAPPNGTVFAIDPARCGPATCQEVWSYPTEGTIAGGLAVAETPSGRQLLLVGSTDGHLYALRTDEGLLPQERLAWRYPPEGEEMGGLYGAPVVVGGQVFFGSLDHSLYVLTVEGGRKVGEFKTEGGIAASLLVEEGRVYVGSFDRIFYALDATNNLQLWSFPAKSWFWGGMASDGVRLYVPTLDGKLYAVDQQGGPPLWDFDLGKMALSMPVLVEGKVVATSDAGRLYLLSAKTGKEEWSYDLGTGVRAPLAVQGPIVFLNGMDHSIRAIDVLEGRQLWSQSTRRE